WREDVHWYGPNGDVDLSWESRALAYYLHGANDLYVMINAFWEPVLFHIQEGKERAWTRLVDTSRQNITEEPVGSLPYQVAPRSIVVLEAN
ncbi:MAG: glycogen debranching protein, partial [Chthoniobacterales bacterium]